MSTKRLTAGVLAALMMAAVLAALLPAGGSARPSATFKAALISDVGHFNDKSFNQSQLAGLNLAKRKLKVQTLAIQSNNSGLHGSPSISSTFSTKPRPISRCQIRLTRVLGILPLRGSVNIAAAVARRSAASLDGSGRFSSG